MKISFTKIINTTLILSILLTPIFSFAFDPNIVGSTTASNNYVPTNGAYDPADPYSAKLNNQYSTQSSGIQNPYDAKTNPVLDSKNIDRQINQIINNATTSTSTQGQGAAGGIAGELGGCGAGQLLSNMIVSSIGNAIGNKTQEVAGSLILVPTSEQGLVGDNIKAQAGATVGTIGMGGVLMKPSWDSIAYCIANAMIAYIADSTIEWINIGFDGNPAFLNNPDMFFKQLADEEAASFIHNLAYGVTGGTKVCDVFKAAMVQSALSQYGQQTGYGYGYDMGGYNRGLSNGFLGCSFDQNPNQLNSFMQGNFTQGGGWNSWYNVSQTQQNNPYETYFNTSDRLNNQIVTTQANQTRDLGWNNGFLNYKKCDDKTKQCTTVTPGNVIQSQLESTLNLPKQRLAFANKFDQVLTTLVNKLISDALGTVLQQGQSY